MNYEQNVPLSAFQKVEQAKDPQQKDKVKDAFNFSVNKEALCSKETGAETPLFGLFRSDTNKIVNSSSVTARYVPHTTDDVLALVESAAKAFDDNVDVDCHFRNGHYVNVQPQADYRRAVYGTKDNVFLRVMIQAGYDGKSFRATVGYFRDACSNLAMLRQVKGTSVIIRHTNSLREKMADLIETFETLKDGWEALQDRIEALEQVEVNISTLLKEVYGELKPDATPRETTIHNNRIETIVSRVVRERYKTERPQVQSGMISGWEAYNAIQGYTQHNASRSRKSTDFDRILLASRDSNVLNAETYVTEQITEQAANADLLDNVIDNT